MVLLPVELNSSDLVTTASLIHSLMGTMHLEGILYYSVIQYQVTKQLTLIAGLDKKAEMSKITSSVTMRILHQNKDAKIGVATYRRFCITAIKH